MENSKYLKNIPSVDKILNFPEIVELSGKTNRMILISVIREELDKFRNLIVNQKQEVEVSDIIRGIQHKIHKLKSSTLTKVINATGTVVHTNLGRSPLGFKVLENLVNIASGYSNLEFDLSKGTRGKRDHHIGELLKYLTGAEDVVIVNNNAAAVLLTLHSLARGKEVIISRGELVEIGGSFRMPEIFSASGAVMVEVGTTNKTHLYDYQQAVNENTAMIIKVHKSNYSIQGFSKEVSVKQLVNLSLQSNLPLLYDIGSGYLYPTADQYLNLEPDVKTAIEEGVDIVSFSGDKLLGGPQSGIIVGKQKYLKVLKNAPLKRALRVGKLTISALTSTLSFYSGNEADLENIPIKQMFNQTREQLEKRAGLFKQQLKKYDIDSEIVSSKARAGGGALPGKEVESIAVKLVAPSTGEKLADKIFADLLRLDVPVVGFIRKGELMFDVYTLSDEQTAYIAEQLSILIK
ncbi:MAG: L-seryl-tRNA(Sec) selenium transferase [bacterium]